MPKGVGCCVPLCTNKSNNSSDMRFYRLSREKSIRQKYHRLLCKGSFSGNARVCSEHFENGAKLSRNHLPSIFPWRKEKCGGIKNTRIPLIDITNIDGKRRKVVSNFTAQSSGVFRGKVAPGISSCLRGFSFVPLTPDITYLNTGTLLQAIWQHFETFRKHLFTIFRAPRKRSHNSARVYLRPRLPLFLQVGYNSVA